MPVLNVRSPAEASDALATLTAAAAGLAALVQSVNVIEVFVPETTAALLGYVQMAGVILIFLVFAPMLILFKRRGGKAAGHGAGGSYLSALLRQAAATAFSVTFVFMIVLSLLDRTVLAHLTAETAVDLLISFALAMFALSFFLSDRFSHLGEGAGEDG